MSDFPPRRCRALFTVLLALGACAPTPLEVVQLDPATLDDGLIAHWTFDEGTGNVVLDHSANGHTGQITGATWIADGRFGGGLHFEEGQFVAVDAFPNATESWSVSAWVRVPDAPASPDEVFKTVISTELEAKGGWEVNIDRSTDQPGAHFGYWAGDAVADYYRLTCTCMTADEWNHIVASVDAKAGLVSVYVGGILRQSMPITHTITPGSSTLYMGKWSGDGRLLVGDVDDVLVYRRALSSAETAALSRSSPPGIE